MRGKTAHHRRKRRDCARPRHADVSEPAPSAARRRAAAHQLADVHDEEGLLRLQGGHREECRAFVQHAPRARPPGRCGSSPQAWPQGCARAAPAASRSAPRGSARAACAACRRARACLELALGFQRVDHEHSVRPTSHAQARMALAMRTASAAPPAFATDSRPRSWTTCLCIDRRRTLGNNGRARAQVQRLRAPVSSLSTSGTSASVGRRERSGGTQVFSSSWRLSAWLPYAWAALSVDLCLATNCAHTTL